MIDPESPVFWWGRMLKWALLCALLGYASYQLKNIHQDLSRLERTIKLKVL